jgi:ribosomal protein S2
MLQNFKLLNLKLANSNLLIKSLKKNSLGLLATISQIKKVFKIIYRYHISKKRIIFIGNPMYINKQLTKMLKKTKHLFVPHSAWVAGHIANRFTRSKISHTENTTKLFSIRKLKKKSSLVVIIDPLKDSIAIKEHHAVKRPIIALNSKADMLNETSTYKIPVKLTSLKAELNLFLFYSLLLSVFKTSHLKKYKRYAKHIQKYKLNLKHKIKKPYRSYKRFNFKNTQHKNSKNTRLIIKKESKRKT